MKSVWETVYLQSPSWMQNIGLSLYGLRIERSRHGGNYRHFARDISSHCVEREALTAYVDAKLREVVKDAGENVPYYRELFRRQGINVGDIKTVEDLNRIPLLEKESVRQGPSRFVRENSKKRHLLCIHTTGTTGTPLRIYCNDYVRQLNYAFYDRFLQQVGIDFRGKRATFGGRIVVPSEQGSPPFWRHSYFQKNLLLSSYHLTDGNIPAYIEKLTKFQPKFIDAYPSSLFTIANYASRNKISLKNVTRGITTSAETLFAEQREIIETIFDVPIFDQYGAAEMCVFVAQCTAGSYHIHSDYGMLEFLREDGSNAKPGEEAELVCTGLINPVMPLIRYRIGDRGVLSSEACICGSSFPVMIKITGRMDDVIVTPDGRKVGRLSPVFKGFPVKEVQYIQRSKDAIEVIIVKDEGYSHETEKHVLSELRKRLGHDISIALKYVQAIPRGNGGKLRSIVSYIGQTRHG